jgi:ABC transporter with metal-binding/Fe-S-binding domain ATP-binding protein
LEGEGETPSKSRIIPAKSEARASGILPFILKFTPLYKRMGITGVLVSGGKDSTFALKSVLDRGHPSLLLISALPEREDSWMFHTPNLSLMDRFAGCVGLPLLKVRVSGEKEKEVEELAFALRGLCLEALVSGAIASRYQKRRIDAICLSLGIRHLAPLWGRDPVEVLREEIAAGMEIIVTSVSAEGLGEEWLGRRLDERAVGELLSLSRKFGFNPAGEGGEYETLVLNAPFFRHRLEVREVRREWLKTRGVLRLE